MHFLLYTVPGSLVLVLVVSALVAVVVWSAVAVALWLTAFALWSLYERLWRGGHRRTPGRVRAQVVREWAEPAIPSAGSKSSSTCCGLRGSTGRDR